MPTPYKPLNKEVEQAVPALIKALDKIANDLLLDDTQMRVIASKALALLKQPPPTTQPPLFPVQAMVIKALTDIGPMTADQVIRELNWSRGSVKGAIDTLHKAGRIYIEGWPYGKGEVSQQRARLFAVRTKPSQIDAPKPPPMSPTERKKRYKRKNVGVLLARQKKFADNPYFQLMIGSGGTDS